MVLQYRTSNIEVDFADKTSGGVQHENHEPNAQRISCYLLAVNIGINRFVLCVNKNNFCFIV